MASPRSVNTARATQQLEEDNGVSATKAKGSNLCFDMTTADGWAEEMIDSVAKQVSQYIWTTESVRL